MMWKITSIILLSISNLSNMTAYCILSLALIQSRLPVYLIEIQTFLILFLFQFADEGTGIFRSDIGLAAWAISIFGRWCSDSGIGVWFVWVLVLTWIEIVEPACCLFLPFPFSLSIVVAYLSLGLSLSLSIIVIAACPSNRLLSLSLSIVLLFFLIESEILIRLMIDWFVLVKLVLYRWWVLDIILIDLIFVQIRF